MTTYVTVSNDDTYSTTTSTQSSGSRRHRIVVGALNGSTILGYSGSVNGTTTFYEVDNGPTLGGGISTS
jgi:hypothetical protein